MHLLGLFGIFKESVKIIFSWRKIFTQITLTVILPLTFIFLGHLEISNLLLRDIKHTEYEKDAAQYPSATNYNNLSDTLLSEGITLLLFKVVFFTILLTLSLSSTAAAVYTIASIYTGRDITFKKVMSIVLKVWKRLMVTFLCIFAAFFVYNFIVVLVIVICLVVFSYSTFGVVPLSVVLIIYVMRFVYMNVIWKLASVVSVLESSYGFKALTKSNNLIKGNKGIAFAIFFMLSLSFILIQFLFELFVVQGSSVEVWKRVGFGVLCSILLLTVFLFGLVIKTILYFVCKSYHHENINKGDLSNHLESYLGEYEPLSGKYLKLEQY